MQVTSQFYADFKGRIAIDMATLLPPANVTKFEDFADQKAAPERTADRRRK